MMGTEEDVSVHSQLPEDPDAFDQLSVNESQ